MTKYSLSKLFEEKRGKITYLTQVELGIKIPTVKGDIKWRKIFLQ